MRRYALFLSAVLVLFCLVLLGGCGPGKYVAKANEELYGTWVSEGSYPQKSVDFAGGYKDFRLLSDAAPISEGTLDIMAKWKDGEGNVWYRIFGTVTIGGHAGTKYQFLCRISKSGKTRESVNIWPVTSYDPKRFPSDINPKDETYRSLNRQE
jgi:hypothetical protein